MNVLIVFLVFCVAFISAEDHLRERRFLLFDVSCQRMFKQSNNAYCILRFVGHFVTGCPIWHVTDVRQVAVYYWFEVF